MAGKGCWKFSIGPLRQASSEAVNLLFSLLKIIEPEEATRLFYAAQVAQSGANREQPKTKRSR